MMAEGWPRDCTPSCHRRSATSRCCGIAACPSADKPARADRAESHFKEADGPSGRRLENLESPDENRPGRGHACMQPQFRKSSARYDEVSTQHVNCKRSCLGIRGSVRS